MIRQTEPSIAKQFSLAIRNRRQPVRGRRIGAISVREINPTLALVSSSTHCVWASGRRAIGRAVREVRRATANA